MKKRRTAYGIRSKAKTGTDILPHVLNTVRTLLKSAEGRTRCHRIPLMTGIYLYEDLIYPCTLSLAPLAYLL